MLPLRTAALLLLVVLLAPLSAGGQSIDGLQVDEEGDVGLGTTSPLTALDVRGDLYLDHGGWAENKIRWDDKFDYHWIGYTDPSFDSADWYMTFASHENEGFVWRLPGGGDGEVMTLTGSDSPRGKTLFVEGQVGIGTSNPSTKLEVQGTITEASARRFKIGIETIEDATALVDQLRGVRYRWKDSGKPDLGFVAEEVEEVLPSLVTHTEDGTVKGLNYSHLTAVLAEALKEQTEAVEVQDRRLARQQERIERLQTENDALRDKTTAQQEQIDALRRQVRTLMQRTEEAN